MHFASRLFFVFLLREHIRSTTRGQTPVLHQTSSGGYFSSKEDPFPRSLTPPPHDLRSPLHSSGSMEVKPAVDSDMKNLFMLDGAKPPSRLLPPGTRRLSPALCAQECLSITGQQLTLYRRPVGQDRTFLLAPKLFRLHLPVLLVPRSPPIGTTQDWPLKLQCLALRTT